MKDHCTMLLVLIMLYPRQIFRGGRKLQQKASKYPCLGFWAWVHEGLNLGIPPNWRIYKCFQCFIHKHINEPSVYNSNSLPTLSGRRLREIHWGEYRLRNVNVSTSQWSLGFRVSHILEIKWCWIWLRI